MGGDTAYSLFFDSRFKRKGKIIADLLSKILVHHSLNPEYATFVRDGIYSIQMHPGLFSKKMRKVFLFAAP